MKRQSYLRLLNKIQKIYTYVNKGKSYPYNSVKRGWKKQ